MTACHDGARVELRVRGKEFRPKLTWLERLAILGRKRPPSFTEKDTLLEEIVLRPHGNGA